MGATWDEARQMAGDLVTIHLEDARERPDCPRGSVGVGARLQVTEATLLARSGLSSNPEGLATDAPHA